MKQLSISKKLIFGTAIVFLLALFSNTGTGNAATTCVVNSAHFTTYGEQPGSFYEENEILENPSNPRPQVSVSINTTGCEGKTLNTSIINIAETPISYVQALTDKALVVPEGGILNITMRTGEDGCSAMAGSFDCKYFIKIVTSDGVKYRTKDSHILNGFSGVWTVLDDPKGVLTYEQHGVTAEDKWVFEQSNGGTPTPVDPTAGTTATTGGDENTYELISDLPLLTELGENLDSIPDGSGIGGILNAIFTIAIGIAGILAVVMIIYHAWEYLTTESITTKVLLKDKLLKIVLGILLLLGSTIILRTINPDLLNIEPNINQITHGDDGEGTETTTGGTPPSTNSSLSAWAQENGQKITLTKTSGGTVQVTPCKTDDFISINVFGGKNVTVHKDIAPLVQRVSAAWAAQGSSKYQIKSIGGYNCRLIANTNKLSNHSYALAIDVNPQENPFISNASGMSRSEYTDMPESFVNLWKAEGFGWGGDWTSKKDAMHFSKIINEKGDQKID